MLTLRADHAYPRRSLAGLALSVGACLLTACLQPDVSPSALTAFEEATPATAISSDPNKPAQPDSQARGADANRRMLGEGAGSGPTATGGGSASPGAGTGTGSGPVAGTGSGPTAGTGTAGTPSGTGSGPAAGTGTAGSPTGTGTAPEVKPVAGTPEPHPHVVRPPGFGSSLPSAPRPEPVPPPGKGVPTGTGSGTGAAAPVPGAPAAAPMPETMLERENKGKKMITVSGTVKYAGKGTGNVDLDCFVPDKPPANRRLVNKVKLQSAGAYTFKVPVNYGVLSLEAFIDLKGDGPDSRDPRGTFSGNPLTIKDKDIKGVDIVLTTP